MLHRESQRLIHGGPHAIGCIGNAGCADHAIRRYVMHRRSQGSQVLPGAPVAGFRILRFHHPLQGASELLPRMRQRSVVYQVQLAPGRCFICPVLGAISVLDRQRPERKEGPLTVARHRWSGLPNCRRDRCRHYRCRFLFEEEARQIELGQ